MHNSRGESVFTEDQIETIKRLTGKKTITEIAGTIKAGFLKTKREMFRLGLVTEFKEPVAKIKIPVEFFDYANEYSYK